MLAPITLIAGRISDAGELALAAGMCRLLARRGVKVVPFKAQNMSNSCAVALDGNEIGRARALRALVCGLEPDVSFNPILLKLGPDHTSQAVVKGEADGHVSALTYRSRRKVLCGAVAETLEELRGQFGVVLCEGAGSPTEVNLRESDIANMGLIEFADLPIVAAGDIDYGGVLAHFVGTHAISSPGDRARITGSIVNKFRDDVSLSIPGLDVVREHTGVSILGVVSFIPGLWVDIEGLLDTAVGASVGLANTSLDMETLSVAAIHLPRMPNATDIEALACEPGVHVQWIVDPLVVTRADLVVLPETKSTAASLKWLRDRGLDNVLENRAARGLLLVGICGGLQMLYTAITGTVESIAGTVNGPDVFDAGIGFAGTKTLVSHLDGSYEVHNGQVVRSSEAPSIIEPEEERVWYGMAMGMYRHGYLENDRACRELLMEVAGAVGRDGFEVSSTTSFAVERPRQVDLLADAVEEYLAGPTLAQATGIEQLG